VHHSSRRSRVRVVAPWLVLGALLPVTGCKNSSTGPAFDLGPFLEMAAHDPCASLRKELFLIDGDIVFWSREGNCADAAYADILYAGSIDSLVCSFHDSVTGPQRSCRDASYRAMFDTILANRDKPDLGLGPGHTVRAVPL
jgi:hypothetical protein